MGTTINRGQGKRNQVGSGSLRVTAARIADKHVCVTSDCGRPSVAALIAFLFFWYIAHRQSFPAAQVGPDGVLPYSRIRAREAGLAAQPERKLLE